MVLSAAPHPMDLGDYSPADVQVSVDVADEVDPATDLVALAGRERAGPGDEQAGGGMTLTEIASTTALDLEVSAGDGALVRVPSGGRLRIVDLHGNQAADTLLYDAADVRNSYSAFDTIREQGAVFLTTARGCCRRAWTSSRSSPRTPSAATTPSAAPARRSPTSSGMASTPVTSTRAGRRSSPMVPRRESARASSPPTSTSS